MAVASIKQSKEFGGIGTRAVLLAWSLCALSLALTAPAILLLTLSLFQPGAHIYDHWLENTIAAVSYAPAGALIASRRPSNPIGWLLCLLGLACAVGHFSSQYAIYTLSAPPASLPSGEVMAWVSSWILPPIVGLQVFAFLLFPTGRLPSRSWRWLAWVTVAFVLVGVSSSALSLAANAGLGPAQNPLGIEGFSSIYDDVVLSMLPLLYVAVASSLLVRLHRAKGVERQQIRWFAYAAGATIGGSLLAYMIHSTIDTPLWFEWVGFAVNIAVTPAIPVAIGIAILRYRLFDIDVLINRTLVYGSLTAMPVLFYPGGVVTLQYTFHALTRQESQLAIVASTLAIAALFNPLRRRIQSFIDRRFYRRRYDARKTPEAFSTRLRDETDFEVLNDELVGVVKETMQPTHISLLLRSHTGAEREGGKASE